MSLHPSFCILEGEIIVTYICSGVIFATIYIFVVVAAQCKMLVQRIINKTHLHIKDLSARLFILKVSKATS